MEEGGIKKARDDTIDLKVALAHRNALFARLQNIFDYSKNANNNDSTRENFLSACMNLEQLRSDFKEICHNYNTLKLQCDSKANIDNQAFSAFEELFCRVKYVYNQMIPSVIHNGERSSDGSIHKRAVRLPPLEILSFEGDIRGWPIFYENFKAIIHSNPSLNDEEKMYYLLSKLSNKAKAAFAGITPCGDNYNLILDALLKRYSDKRTLATAHLASILDFKSFDSATTANFESFLDIYVTAANSLKTLGLVDVTDFIILNIALKKLDKETVRAFEMAFRNENVPTFESLVDFVRGQDKIVKIIPLDKPNVRSSQPARKPPQPQAYVAVAKSQKCLCDTELIHDHLFKCPAFNEMTPTERFAAVKNHNACVNCLSLRHKALNCASKAACRACHKRHHTSLHFESKPYQALDTDAAAVTDVAVDTVAATAAPLTSESTSETQHCLVNAIGHRSSRELVTDYKSASHFDPKPSTILLATATVLAVDATGQKHPIRCLLDSASQSNFLTWDCCKRLNLHKKMIRSQLKVKGLGGTEKIVKGTASFAFSSRFNSEIKYESTSLVVDKITEFLPTAPVDMAAMPQLKGLPLADSSFGTPGGIDALLGASLFPHFLLPGTVNLPGIPPVIETVLGYVLMGSAPAIHVSNALPIVNCCIVQYENESQPRQVDKLLQKFWQLDESPLKTESVSSEADLECEYFYKQTTTRDKDGRYTVALPFCADPESLGDSFETARRRFLCLERKLLASPDIRSAYDDVIREYLDKGYLIPTPLEDVNSNAASYTIPHHAIIRQDKTSTKLRAVLDASCKTTTALSLNDVLHSGPNLQGDLFTIILNYRLFAVALSADCKQMFLQIGVRPADQRFQRILYRFSVGEPLIVYQYSRVCFGLKSSPYHALRTVQQLIDDDGDHFLLARDIASNSIYMDDIVFSLRSIDTAVVATQELINLFKGGQFDLVKWTSNSQTVLDHIPASHRNSEQFEFEKMQVKILGLRWSQVNDRFEFHVTTPDKTCTKRAILSTVARLWDIMGFVAPVVLFAKLLIKELWLLKIDWDESPPANVASVWDQFCAELSRLNELSIPRHIGVVDDCVVRLIAFADASERAYGAVVYAHIVCGSEIKVQLVCSKSKVSPVKPLSIARLELCAAELMSKLLRRVHDTYNPRYNIEQVYAFTDSKVVLCWLNASPHRWQTFVANRVVRALENIPADRFFHVAGTDNPADCLSRGLMPSKLIDHPLWFCGPLWVQREPAEWPIFKIEDLKTDPAPEEKVHVYTALANNCTEPRLLLLDLSVKVSSWSKLIRIIVYVCRFVRMLPRRDSSAIVTSEVEFAERVLFKNVQTRHFADDIDNLSKGKGATSSLMKLCPFLKNGLLLVGGRLSHSAESLNKKHPVVLPRHDRVVELLIDYYHRKHFHAGPEHLMSLLRERFWILSARSVIRHRIHKCNFCYKTKPRPLMSPIMSDLPASRVNQVAKAFVHTGCDYAGPITYTPMRSRGVKSRKGYICVFTCLTTRAIHIELATDLTTVSFLSALKRFLARRGPVSYMYSDNGTNFVGARGYLRDLYDFINKEYRPEETLVENRIEWKTIPPAAPHHGGCWESMVKCVKTHLFKTIGQQILSYEELVTVLAQIECILNSRPLTTLSSDPAEPTALTPAHFLHTAPLFSLPALPEIGLSENQISQRHVLVDKLIQSFWKRWRREYLYKLQIREKWNKETHPIKEGTVVIVVNDNAPPLSWPLGVIQTVHPAKDGRIRVVTVRTAKGILVRPVIRLCPLPTQ